MGKAIGIDFGLKRTGFAISDDSGIIASPLETIDSRNIPDYLDQIITKEKSQGKKLNVEDYRKDERLRALVISNIISQEKEQFEDILDIYNPKINQLKKEIEKLKWVD